MTCGDMAAEVRVLSVDEAQEVALCADAAGARSTVQTALLERVACGEKLLVHAGCAIARLGGAA